MKINIILPNLHASGGIKVIVHYAKAMVKEGHRVAIISALYPNYKWKDRLKIKLGMQPSWMPTSEKEGLEDLDVIISKNPYKVKEGDCPDADLIIATWWETAHWIKKFAARKGKKVYFIQGYEAFDNQPYDKVISTYCDERFSKIVVSPWLKKVLDENHKLKGAYEVYNGVDTKLYSRPNDCKVKDNSVGVIMSPLHCKGSDLAIKAILALKYRVAELRVNIVSHSTATECGIDKLESWMSFYQSPNIDLLRRVYASTACWLFPSREEGFGLPILESLSCGTPVVAFNAGAASEIIDSEVGAVCSDHNPLSMADQAKIWIDKRNVKELVTERCVKRSEQWSLSVSTKKFQAVLASIHLG